MATRHLEPLLRCLRKAAVPDATAALPDAELLARFAAGRDEAAFAVLVRRHGPLVLGVCRRVLRDLHAAEDAFQATFLVLARKAGSLARPHLLAHWLHGVACRTAVRARADAARRRAHERQAAGKSIVAPPDDLDWRDLRPVLDEEVNRLPTRYRVPFVLCYLDGLTNAEAALRLGCSRGTVATLLARARERLRRRLTGRGLALPAVLATVSAALEFATARAAATFAAGTVPTTKAACLAEGVAKAMMLKKVKIAAAVLLVMGLVGGGGGAAVYRAAAQAPAQAEEYPQAPPALAPRAVPVPAPRPVPPAANASHRSANFKVSAPTPEIAEKVCRAAEKHRKALALLWLGRVLPIWPEPCPVHVKITETGSGGATSFAFRPDGTVQEQRMNLEGPLDKVLADCLPHEVAHTILAHHFGRPVPRWADEGAAVSSESAASRDQHQRRLWDILDTGRRLPLHRLLAVREFPRDVMVLYLQGYSLTEFLVESGGRSKFLAFVAQGDRDGWKEAVKEHYGYKTIDDLEDAWLRRVRKDRQEEKEDRTAEGRGEVGPPPETKPAEPARPKGELPTGAAPMQALVRLGKGGRLSVWKSGPCYYEPQTTYTDRGQAVTTYVPRSVWAEEIFDVEDVKVYDAAGKRVEKAKLARLLKEETLVLVSADGQPVDPLQLRLVKEGTLVFVLPMPTPPPAVGVPAASPVPAPVPAIAPRKDAKPDRP